VGIVVSRRNVWATD
jgi:hypothetical protein